MVLSAGKGGPFLRKIASAVFQWEDSDNGQKLLALLTEAKKKARTPISGFKVGAAALCASGRIYLGANMEYRSLPLNFTSHAEQAAIVNAWIHGETSVSLLVVSESPCGLCRQFLSEIAGANKMELILPDIPEHIPLPMLLPEGFCLSDDDSPLMSVKAPTDKLLYCSNAEETALAAAGISYVPYSGCPSGIALECTSGKVYGGACIENGAFNPGLLPIQTAMINWAMNGSVDDAIRRCVLAETPGIVSQKAATEIFLKATTPDAVFSRITVCSSEQATGQFSTAKHQEARVIGPNDEDLF